MASASLNSRTAVLQPVRGERVRHQLAEIRTFRLLEIGRFCR